MINKPLCVLGERFPVIDGQRRGEIFNTFSQNTFQANRFDVATNGNTVLNTFDQNYWDKYNGYDLNRDGTGDVPYHPVSLYSMIIEQMPHGIILLRSFMVSLLDQTEKMIPSLTGKTTLIKSILGLVIPDAGDIQFQGESIWGGWPYRQHIGYMPQIGRYPDNMTIRQVFTMMKELRAAPPFISDTPLDEELTDAFDLYRHIDKPMRSLSGGTRQKVSACLAFLFNPKILILDEPTAGLDPVATEILKDKIRREKEKGKLILITSHILSDLEELTSEVMYLQEGQLQFFNTVDWLKDITGEQRLSRAVAHLMKERVSNPSAQQSTLA